jgi:type I restriction enzyme S subunit
MSIKDLGAAGLFIGTTSEYLTCEAVERFRVRRIPDGTVVLSFKLTVGRVSITDGEMLSNEAIAHFLPHAATSIPPEFLCCYLRQFDYERLGSTSSIATAVNSDSVRAMPLLVPADPLAARFGIAVRAFFERVKVGQRETQTLAATRDTLLPRLLSGELRVPLEGAA